MIGQSGLLVHSNPTTASDDAQAAPTDPNGKRGEFAQAMADTETSPATQGNLSSTEAGTDTEPSVGLRRVEASLAMQVETTPDLARPIERSPETRNDRTTFQQEPPSAPRGLKAASELPAVSLTLNKEVNALSANGAVASDRFSPSSNGEAVAELSSGSSVMSDITRLIPSSDSSPKNEAQANKELPTSIFANPQTAAELETDVTANPSLAEIGQQVWGEGREWAGLSDTVNKQIGIGLADSPPKPEQTLPSSNPPATQADESAIIATSVGATLPTEAAQQRQLTANLPSPQSADAGLIPSRVDPDADGAQLQGGRGMGTHPDPEASNNYWRSAAVPTDAKAIFSHDGASSRSEQKLQTAVVQPGVESESLLNAPPTDGPRSATTYVTASAQAELGFTTPSGSQLAATNNPAPMLQSAMTVRAKTSVAALQPLNELEGGVLGATNTASPTSLKADAPVSATPPVATDPKAVTQQIVQALVRMDGARTEVTLDPIELGRVSLIFVTKDDGVNVIVSTERSETADLLRRNSEQLQRDLTNAGYEGVELDFEDGGEEQRGQSRTDATDSPGAFPERPTQSQSLLITTGLDIRL